MTDYPGPMPPPTSKVHLPAGIKKLRKKKRPRKNKSD